MESFSNFKSELFAGFIGGFVDFRVFSAFFQIHIGGFVDFDGLQWYLGIIQAIFC